MMKVFSFFLVSFLFIAGLRVFAELRAEILISPEYPKAYEQVSVRLQSYSFDVDLSTIVWKVDGAIYASGFGKKAITLTTKGTGEVTLIEAKATLPNGDFVTVIYNLSPQGVDLVWEAVESYVPPFYEGKALPGEGSLVRITALPSFVENGRLLNSTFISYSWSINDETLPNQSGAGKQTLTTRLDYLSDSSVVDVIARSPSGSVARSRITIYPTQTLPLFYEYDEILGPNRSFAITKRLETKREISLKLEPFFLSKVDSQDPGDTYVWTLDGLPIQTQTNTLIKLKPKENTFGTKKLSVLVENTKRRLQQTTADLLIVFDSR